MTLERRANLERLLPPRVLRLLVELEERGGVGAAARVVGMTQPSASRALAALERELGYALLRRTPLGSTLTSEGAALVGQARDVLAHYTRLLDLARNFNDANPTDVRIAASRTVGEHLVPKWLGALARELPHVRVAFHVDNSEAVIAEVISGQTPLGFVETPDLPAAVDSQILTRDCLVAIAPPNVPDLPQEISIEQLANERLVEREPGSGTRATLDQLLPNRPAAAAQFDSNTAIVQAVAAGVGMAVLSELAAHEAMRTGRVRVIPWDQAPPPRPLRAIWAADANLPEVAARILNVVREAMAGS